MYNTTISNPISQVYNYLRTNSFRFQLKEAPNVSFTCQSANIPLISFGAATQPTPFIDIPRIGDKLIFQDLQIEFIISENFDNYLEIYNWLIAMGFPNDYDQFSSFFNKRNEKFPILRNDRVNNEILAYSDATLSVLDSDDVAKVNIVFKDLFPKSLSVPNVNIVTDQQNYMIATATFGYRIFDVIIL